ncbi:MAG: hypothetical protein ACP5D3_07780 [Sulfurovum sp.]
MQILLLNTNPVVSRLITLCLKDRHAELYEFSSLGEVEKKSYDLAFIDDASYEHIDLDTLQKLHIAKLVLLTSHPDGDYNPADIVIKKPFLPSRIIEVIDALELSETFESPMEEEETPHIFPLSAEEESEETESLRSQKILDLNEIEKIKSLLEMDEEILSEDVLEKDEEELESLKREVIKQNLIDEGLEIMDEESVVEAVEKDVTFHITHDAQKSEEQKEEFETKLLDALTKMKIKKLKKLLQGAEVTINIKFRDGENE